MRVTLLAVGSRMPAWVNHAVDEYRRRLPPQWRFELREIAAAKRARGRSGQRDADDEGERLLRAVRPGAWLVALDERGRGWSTRELAGHLEAWAGSGRDLAFAIGGADGLSPALLERADRHWSLSALTLPHALARVVVVEQLYRAHTVSVGHPYHRD